MGFPSPGFPPDLLFLFIYLVALVCSLFVASQRTYRVNGWVVREVPGRRVKEEESKKGRSSPIKQLGDGQEEEALVVSEEAQRLSLSTRSRLACLGRVSGSVARRTRGCAGQSTSMYSVYYYYQF